MLTPHILGADSRARWLSGSLLWVMAGFVFPVLAPATRQLSCGLQRYLSSSAGMPEELAFRVAFTIVRIPLTAVVVILLAAAQCVLLQSVKPIARRWITAA